ncbi:hypothetical protein TNCV_3911651 [Trichonephila clavipes]|nr:hypothetical protein TNCV_3911651 [Trichonephila clavipes]
MVSPAVQRTSTTSSIVPAFLRSTSCGMTSARGYGVIVYCLNSGSEDRQTGRHNGEEEEKKGRKKSGENGRKEKKKTGEREERQETEKDKKKSWGERREEPAFIKINVNTLEIQKSTTRGLLESKPKLSAGTPGGEKIRHSDSDS